MQLYEAVERLAGHVGLTLARDDERKGWMLRRGQKVIHREHTLTGIQGFLSAWAQHVR